MLIRSDSSEFKRGSVYLYQCGGGKSNVSVQRFFFDILCGIQVYYVLNWDPGQRTRGSFYIDRGMRFFCSPSAAELFLK